jgi:holliday junction DNA helicase RuvA
MIHFIEGTIEEKTPAYVVINCSGTGYQVQISLNTYSRLPDTGFYRILTCQIIREDANILYGFSDKSERDLFLQLISVSGVGPNSARLLLSSILPQEIRTAIVSGNTQLLQSVKGIGAKSAQRIIVDLKDKLEKEGVTKEDNLLITNNTIHEEALSALVMLGFAKNAAQKSISAILKNRQGTAVTVEELVKEALKNI